MDYTGRNKSKDDCSFDNSLEEKMNISESKGGTSGYKKDLRTKINKKNDGYGRKNIKNITEESLLKDSVKVKKQSVMKKVILNENSHSSKYSENEPLLRSCEMENLFKDYCLIEGTDMEENPETGYSSINSGYDTKSPTISLSSEECLTDLETGLFLGSSIILSRRRLSDTGAPRDKFFLVHLTAYFLGMTGILPLTFFLVANDYWMYKFRDVSMGEYNLNNKTYFQTMFVSMSSACSSFPCLISILLTIFLGHKMDGRKRIIISLGIASCLFVISTALIKINTDTWQYPFFLLTLTVISVLAFIQPLLNITSMSYMSKLPPSYVEWSLYGSAAGGLCGSTLQIISLSIGKNSVQIALIYFTIGTILMGFTCILAFAMKYSPVIQHYNENEDGHSKCKHTMQEYWDAANRVWFITLMMIVLALGAGIGHPNITNLIVSEGYTGTGRNMWYDKYFAVTAVYFLFDIFQLLGRLAGRPLVKKNNYHWFLLSIILRTYGVGILFWFCNAQPRNYLPIWFPRDYQYMSIMAVYSFLGSALATSAVLSIASIAKEKTEIAYIVTISSTIFIQTFASLLNPMFVTLL